ncbi:hypothetical protein MKEN_01225600 [Mycena kentingensis (nom. inval.)]|nr:hypothetical protein MKEN_01225600 [Mycena kentingensis (nom. inval.)]
MLSIATAQHLAVVDPATLKKSGASSIPTSISLLASPTASTWAAGHLYVASGHTIHQYDPALNRLTDVFEADANINHLVAGPQSTLVFATTDKIHLLEGREVKRTLAVKLDIVSISTSGASVAVATATSAQIFSLTTGSSSSLRGYTGEIITACAFHPHSNKLLVGLGKKLAVYDATRPSAPTKIIETSSAGDIISIACSPFSTTLVAVATDVGYVGLVDLNKEKGLFRTLNLKVGVTCAAFSPEGASLFIGSDAGKLLVVDLRALDKPPKAIAIGLSDVRIETISVQKKSKGSNEPEAKPSVASNARVAAVAASTLRPSAAGVRSPLSKTTVSPRAPAKKAAVVSSPKVPSRAPSRNPSAAISSRSSSSAAPSESASSRSVGTRRASASTSSTRTVQTAGARAKSIQQAASRTPSPELPSIHMPTTPVAAGKGWSLESPERAADTAKAKSKGKAVNFESDEKENERERSLSMQISPRRPTSGTGTGNWAPSPLRNAIPGSPAGASSSSVAAQELLRGIVRDVMHDFQQEQRAEMVGLHLDMLKMGRGLRAQLDDYFGDLNALREENRRLREENEFLRRGY